MIWIEGKSSAWIYLSELELTPFVKKPESSDAGQSIAPSDEIEKKAEELRQKVLTSAPKNQFTKPNVEIETYSSSYKLPEDEIQFIDHREEIKIKQTAVIGELLLTGVVIGLFVIGIYKGKSFLGARHKVQNSVATQLNSNDNHTAKKNALPTHSNILPADTATKNIASTDTITRLDSLRAMQKMKPKIAIKKSVDTLRMIHAQTINASVQDQPDKKEEAVIPPPVSIVQKKASDIQPKKEVRTSTPESKSNNENSKEEKRGFLRGLFKKKKKEDKKD
jgi:hypothetical protein